MPLAYKKRVRQEISNQEESGTNRPAQGEKDVCDGSTRYRFALRPYWFVLAQTEASSEFPTLKLWKAV